MQMFHPASEPISSPEMQNRAKHFLPFVKLIHTMKLTLSPCVLLSTEPREIPLDPAGGSWSCKDFGSPFSFQTSVTMRRRTVHQWRGTYHHCRYCNYSSYDKTCVARHERTHTGERPFDCQICGKAFTRKCLLIIHERTHTGEKPFKCKLCGQAFSQAAHLSHHQMVHTGAKPFKCQICGKDFARKFTLLSHYKVHSSGRLSGRHASSDASCNK
ncbi:zinc finger protein 257-like [Ixodes scapularis]|uniref:zinc finger protein 257-like n=1 Tax=Ixodes scapularis TaxID=6945 RepID=UPI001AD6A74E|nr:zinc finger protein 257-like [Ixodes scapularis]